MRILSPASSIDDARVWGRPVGIAQAKDGSLLFSEDGNGMIWRVSYVGHLLSDRSVTGRAFEGGRRCLQLLPRRMKGASVIAKKDRLVGSSRSTRSSGCRP